MEFFTFYANFDFASHGLCLKHAERIERSPETELHPLYIKNYFLPDNIARNVTSGTLQLFQHSCLQAVKILERTLNAPRAANSDWGIVGLLKHSELIVATQNSNSKLNTSFYFVLLRLICAGCITT